MRHHTTNLLALMLTIVLLSTTALALNNPALEQQNLLPRDQYLNLVSPEKVNLNHIKVKFSEDTRVRLRDGGLVSPDGASLNGIHDFLNRHPEIVVERPWAQSEEYLDNYTAKGEARSGIDLADLNNWYAFVIKGDNKAPRQLLEEILAERLVQTCFYYPKVDLATCNADVAPSTGYWEGNQGYRDPAPDGIGIDYAWNYHPDGNGVSTYWVIDVEQGWCPNHEDMDDLFQIYDYDAANSTDHGSAVVSIVAACDNGFGITGLTPDVRIKGRNWEATNGGTYPDVSDAIVNTGVSLIDGETYLIEIHAPGPSQGTTCPCNCTQFEYIAMEYWQDNFDAILANATAEGLICMEAAGNGSMNLDWWGYASAFDRSFRDCRAIIVGASESSTPHEPACFTNHGSAIDVYGWGGNVYSHGYGYLFSGAGDCTQEYDYDFGGTSSATPICTGAAIATQLIYEDMFGSYLAPTTLRSWLQINGTPQGPGEPTHEISVLPNMKGILAPDLSHQLLSGWDDIIVPTLASGDPRTIPANLSPTPASTYMCWSWVNWSRFSYATPARAYLYRDDQYLVYAFNDTLPAWTNSNYSWWGTQVRGGRHYIKEVMDAQGDVDEGNEDNNTYIQDYVWDGIELVADVPQTYTRGPLKNPEGYGNYACDGFWNGGDFSGTNSFGYWEVFGAMPSSLDTDYDVRLHSLAPTATSGFDIYEAWSGYITYIDFVGVNNNLTGYGDWVSVINYSDGPDDYTIEGDGSHYMGNLPATQMLFTSDAIDAGEILDVFEINGDIGEEIWLNVDITSGDADLGIYIYGPSTDYFTRSTFDWALNANGGGESESGIFTVTEDGYHGLVITKMYRSELNEHANYDFYWGPPQGDLVHEPYIGWDNALVARESGVGSSGTVPPTLNEGNAVADNAYLNIGAGIFASGTNTKLYLDGPEVYESGEFIGFSPGQQATLANRSIGYVTAGRHEVGAVLDVHEETPEELPDGENNNYIYNQYSWTGYELTHQLPVLRDPPPNYYNSENPEAYIQPGRNLDGYTFETHYWTVVGVTPLGSGDFYNIAVYSDHTTSSTDGFINQAAVTYSGSGQTGFVVMNGNVLGSNQSRDFGIRNNFQWPSIPSVNDYHVEASESQDDIAVEYPYGPIPMLGNALIDSYDLYIPSAGDYSVTMTIDGNVDLGIVIFEAGVDYAGISDGLLNLNSGGAGITEHGTFTTASTGWHGIVVYKTSHIDIPYVCNYSFVVSGALSRVPAPVTDLTITPVDLTGYPYVWDFQFSDVTQDIHGLPLVVDYYRIYWSYDPYATFPGGWSGWMNNTSSEFLNASTVIGSLYFLVTAIDEDGMMSVTQNGKTTAYHVDEVEKLTSPSAVAGDVNRKIE